MWQCVCIEPEIYSPPQPAIQNPWTWTLTAISSSKLDDSKGIRVSIGGRDWPRQLYASWSGSRTGWRVPELGIMLLSKNMKPQRLSMDQRTVNRNAVARIMIYGGHRSASPRKLCMIMHLVTTGLATAKVCTPSLVSASITLLCNDPSFNFSCQC